MEEESKNPIQVAEKLFRVIELLAENGPMGIMELSASLGFHKSTVHRLVASLQYMGYIRQDEESLKYYLSLKFLEIGSRILEQTSMAALIHPSLKRLSEQTGETVHLVKREGTEAVYIDKVESFASSIRMVSRVGSRIPLYCSGVGKALLAELTAQSEARLQSGESFFYADAPARVRRFFSPQRFYLTGDSLAVFFPMLSLAPAAEGIPVFLLPRPDAAGEQNSQAS